MGPNGSGKSTLANTLLGNPAYTVTAGRITVRGTDVTELPIEERAALGLFLGFQHPEEIPGVSVLNFLRQAIAQRKGIDDYSVLEVRMQLIAWTKRLGMDSRFQERYLNEGFSGGEKKRNEMLQMALLEPVMAVLDETDSGLDIDALREVAAGIEEIRKERTELGILLITHYQRILDYLRPDVVHVLIDGRIVAVGDADLAGSRKRASTPSASARRRLHRESGQAQIRRPGRSDDADVIEGRRSKPHEHRRRGDQARVPVARTRGERPAGHVPRLRVVGAEAARGARRDGPLLPALLRQHPSGRVHDRRGGHRGLRARAAQGRPLRERELRVGDRVRAQRDRGDQPGCVHVGPGEPARGRRDRAQPHGAPRQRRALAHARRRAGCRAALDPDDRRLPARPHRPAPLLDGARLLAITAMSNVLGTLNQIRPLADAAHAHDALVLVDACQYVPHVETDVQAWDADFVAFSAHKMCGPSGIGALWARKELLEEMPPFLGGGEMIRDVRLDGFTTNDVPWKFEAGTMPIAEAVGFGAAVDYMTALGMPAVRDHEMRLTRYALDALTERFPDSLRIFGPLDTSVRGGAVSFLFDGIHAHDISQVLDEDAVCVRAGHHCAKPLMRQLGVPATTRASFYVYNDESDVDVLIDALAKAQKFFTP